MTISIIIDTNSGPFLMDVPENISIFELKQRLLDEEGIYLRDEPLMYDGIILRDSDTLEDYDIRNKDRRIFI